VIAKGFLASTVIIGVPKYKAEGNSDRPLSDETRRFLQSRVETVYDAFVADTFAGVDAG
jgi:hypothetical protein